MRESTAQPLGIPSRPNRPRQLRHICLPLANLCSPVNFGLHAPNQLRASLSHLSTINLPSYNNISLTIPPDDCLRRDIHLSQDRYLYHHHYQMASKSEAPVEAGPPTRSQLELQRQSKSHAKLKRAATSKCYTQVYCNHPPAASEPTILFCHHCRSTEDKFHVTSGEAYSNFPTNICLTNPLDKDRRDQVLSS
jgi:hypothetical protein